jgi:hypothetical protein
MISCCHGTQTHFMAMFYLCVNETLICMQYREYLLFGLTIIMLLRRTLFHVSRMVVGSEIRKLKFALSLYVPTNAPSLL